MTQKYNIHPAIGIARLGNSPSEFCISPEKPAGLPLECDACGNAILSPDGKSEETIKTFKDERGRIKRQAARFQIYVHDDDHPEGRPLKIGDPVEGGGNHGTLIDIHWRVYLANKKSCWNEFSQQEGEHGYASDHPLRNASITDTDERQRLIIDPGPRIINTTDKRKANLDRNGDGLYAPNFPPPLEPNNIDSLGEIISDNDGRLLVLGAFGNSGSTLDPAITNYANNDGWFDDTADGSVMARLAMYSEEVGAIRFVDVEYPAWVVTAYPSYVPEVLDMITMDDVLYNLSITQFATRTDLYGEAGTFKEAPEIDSRDQKSLQHWRAGRLSWNPEYKPWFYRDVWPILFRPDEFTYLNNILQQSNAPHNQSGRGTFDPDRLSMAPKFDHDQYKIDAEVVIDEHHRGISFVSSLAKGFSHVASALKRAHLDQSEIAKRRAAYDAAMLSSAAKFVKSILRSDSENTLEEWENIYRANSDEYQKAEDAFKNNIAKAAAGLAKGLPPEFKGRLISGVESGTKRQVKSFRSGDLLEADLEELRIRHTFDPMAAYRQFLFNVLRNAGEENLLKSEGRPNSRTHNLPLMPLLSGDNPISNTLPSKFLRLTDYQLYILRQWAAGLFYNDKEEGWTDIDPFEPYKNLKAETGGMLDRYVLSNLAGGAFCPGCEVGWIMRNTSVYNVPYRIKADPDFYNFRQTAANATQNSRLTQVPDDDYISYVGIELSQKSDFTRGLQPGDFTKYMALPWQSDFNECSTQPIDITYESWNNIYPKSENDPDLMRDQQIWETMWWPAHRPLQTWEAVSVVNNSVQYQILGWTRGVPQTNAGDLKMVTEWKRLGFVIRNPYVPASDLDKPSPDTKYISVERDGAAPLIQ